MRRIFLAALFLCGLAAPAVAQGIPNQAIVVSGCGTPPSTYTPGANQAILQDVNGRQCGNNVSQGPNADGSILNLGASSIITQAQCSALCANLVVKATPGNLINFQVAADSTLSGAAWWVIIYNATAAPSDGSITPAKCFALASGTTHFEVHYPNAPYFSTGIVVGASTTGCFTKTASTHAFISADLK